ncbi:MAG: hypothetical protein ACE5DZ_07120 [Mariprofundus sp.]
MTDHHRDTDEAGISSAHQGHDHDLPVQQFKAELVHALSDIESKLDHYVLKKTEVDAKDLALSMKSFLKKLNSHQNISLDFRLKVLNRFEQELDLFNAEITGAMFKAHQIAIVLVQQKARKKPACLPDLIDMIANAIELAVRLLLIDLKQYRVPQMIVTRHVFELARLGLEAASGAGDTIQLQITRLHQMLCNHELLRKLNFFGQPLSHQKKIWQELQHHTRGLKPHLFHHGDSPDDPGCRCLMLINLYKPNQPGRIIDHMPKYIEHDCIIIPLDSFVSSLNRRIRDNETILKDDQKQQEMALHTDKGLEDILFCDKAILAMFKTGNRPLRYTQSSLRIQLCLDPRTAIDRTSSDNNFLTGVHHKPENADTSNAWNIVDINRYGVRLERMSSDSLASFPNSMAGLNWFDQGRGRHQKKQFRPGLGFIRWAREYKAGEQCIGIEFLDHSYQLAKAALAQGQREIDNIPALPVLIKQDESSHSIIFPETSIYNGIRFMVLQNNRRTYLKVKKILVAGQNYTLCKIVAAKNNPVDT